MVLGRMQYAPHDTVGNVLGAVFDSIVDAQRLFPGILSPNDAVATKAKKQKPPKNGSNSSSSSSSSSGSSSAGITPAPALANMLEAPPGGAGAASVSAGVGQLYETYRPLVLAFCADHRLDPSTIALSRDLHRDKFCTWLGTWLIKKNNGIAPQRSTGAAQPLYALAKMAVQKGKKAGSVMRSTGSPGDFLVQLPDSGLSEFCGLVFALLPDDKDAYNVAFCVVKQQEEAAGGRTGVGGGGGVGGVGGTGGGSRSGDRGDGGGGGPGGGRGGGRDGRGGCCPCCPGGRRGVRGGGCGG